MNIIEFNKIKNLSYLEYCDYLQNKYGKATVNYFNENLTSRNAQISRTNEGLFAHHKFENKVANLSNLDIAKNQPYAYQSADNIIYCDALEHLLLHELISETPNISYSLGIGGARKIISFIASLYNNQNLQPWELSCREAIREQQDVFEILKDRLNDRSFLLEHNENVYAILEDTLEHSNKALVLIGTGGGKTTTALEYQRLHNTNTLVLCPTHIIQDGWKGHNNITTITHAGFLSQYKSIDFNNYNLIIIDEAHHMASSTKAGQALKQVMYEHPEIKFIGLTAESKRNDGLIIAQDMYDNNLCEGVTVLDGIKNGSLYPFSYVGAYYDTNSLKKEYEHEALKGELDLAINNTPTLKNIILSNMPTGPRKGIIFVSTIEAIPEALAIMKDIYPNAEYRSIYSGMNTTTIETNKEWFKHTTEGYLISINMISEGAHYKGVNTLIMFRHTESPLVFNQQLGRVITLTKYDNPNAIVFDLVNNAFTTFEDKHDYGESKEIIKLLQDISKSQGERQIHKSENIIVKDYTSDIDKVLEKIKEANSDRWLDWEIDILKKYYETEGPEVCQMYLKKLWKTNYEISKEYTLNAIRQTANKLNLHSPRNWSAEEEQIIEQYYVIESVDFVLSKLAELGSHRSRQCVMAKAKSLSLKSSIFWSNEEDAILYKYYPVGGAKECFKYLKNRNLATIKERARRLNINGQDRSWTNEEITIIKQFGTFGTNRISLELSKINSNRNTKSIYAQAHKLGIKISGNKRTVICIETKQFFNSTTAAKELGGSKISEVCNGHRSTAGGYHWRWATEEETRAQKCLDDQMKKEA